jgi:hypothetical protein
MHITNFLGDNLGLIYTTDDRWFEDVSFFIKEAHKHKVDLDSEIDALEIVSAHLLYWYFRSLDKNDSLAIDLYHKNIQKNRVLLSIAKDDNPTPECIIYTFNGISVYDKINGATYLDGKSISPFEFELEKQGTFFLSNEEIIEMGGEINFPEEDEDEIEIYLNNSDVFYFMTEKDLKSLGEHMRLCISELNGIYRTFKMPIIESLTKRKASKRIYVEITESWGDGSAFSTIKISRRQWSKILNGEKYEISAKSYYEGEQSIVDWWFEDGKLSISGEDYTCLIDEIDVTDLDANLIGLSND